MRYYLDIDSTSSSYLQYYSIDDKYIHFINNDMNLDDMVRMIRAYDSSKMIVHRNCFYFRHSCIVFSSIEELLKARKLYSIF